MRPVDAITLRESAAILGCTISSVRRRILEGRLAAGKRYRHRTLSRADVEALAVETYAWARHLHDPTSYWVTGSDAAAVLGVNRSGLGHLARAGLLPYVVHRSGTRMYRRAQLTVIGNARRERWPDEAGSRGVCGLRGSRRPMFTCAERDIARSLRLLAHFD
ncbi:MAG: hypothetical protein ACR2LE_03315 [Nocardioidaceae bacterium]